MSKVITVPAKQPVGWTPWNLSLVGAEAYERAWFDDFRTRWQEALRNARRFTYVQFEPVVGGTGE